MLHRFVADCVSFLTEPKRKTINANHGFRKEMGLHTAVLKLIRDYDRYKEPMIYEFDLKAFFNKVPWA